MSVHDALLEELRPRAFAIAYRMLGSVADAQDIVQEALLRVHGVLQRGERLDSPVAYVATVATRLALDELRSARVRRESYVGDWLPEPLVEDRIDAERNAELADSLSIAFLLLLETLTPEQRAALLLRDAFDYAYAEIAAIIGTSEANARQLVTRARRHVREGKRRFEPSAQQHHELASRFFAAAREGDVAALEQLLAEDVVLRGDGGGNAPALARPLTGRQRVARTLAAWGANGARGRATLRQVVVNGQPGAIAMDAHGRIVSVMALAFHDNEVRAVTSVVNPDKLGHLGRVGNLGDMLRSRRPAAHS